MKRLILLTTMVLFGCAGDAPPPTVLRVTTDTYCRIAKPLTWSVHDSTETIDGIRQSNARFTCACSKSKKPPICTQKAPAS